MISPILVDYAQAVCLDQAGYDVICYRVNDGEAWAFSRPDWGGETREQVEARLGTGGMDLDYCFIWVQVC